MTTGPLSTPPSEARNRPQNPWWVDAVIYQVYPRSFADANGDGMGDLAGVTAQLPYLEELGVDALWVSPFYSSPQQDGGYDVADYRDVDPLFGSLDDADRLIEAAHNAGLRVIVDLVPNHTSSAHPWFVEALAADPATEAGQAARNRYMFRPGAGVDGSEPPNNWQSTFGGPAWTRTIDRDGSPGEWYLHLFDSSQPDLNWENLEVRGEFEDILRFWLDRGVDGFRVDVAHGLVKADGLPDHGQRPGMVTDAAAPTGSPTDTPTGTPTGAATATATGEDVSGHREDNPRDHAHPVPYHDQEGVHEVYRAWNEVLSEYDHDPVLVAEAWVSPLERLFRYVREGEMHQAFNFTFLMSGWDAVRMSDAITVSLEEASKVGSTNTWVLSNHDTVRHVSRFGLTDPTRFPSGIGAEDEQPDEALGWKRGRAAAMIELGLPGSAYIYQGDELGLPEHTTLDDALRQDPTFFRTGGAEKGRDGCRIPMPWRAGAPGFGFAAGTAHTTPPDADAAPAAPAAPWLPQPESYGPLAADRQVDVEGSTFELYRELLGVRGELDLGTGSFAWSRFHSPEHGVLAFTVATGGGQHLGSGERIPEKVVLVMANMGEAAIEIPEDYAAAIFSHDEALEDGQLMPDSAAWFLKR